MHLNWSGEIMSNYFIPSSAFYGENDTRTSGGETVVNDFQILMIIMFVSRTEVYLILIKGNVHISL